MTPHRETSSIEADLIVAMRLSQRAYDNWQSVQAMGKKAQDEWLVSNQRTSQLRDELEKAIVAKAHAPTNGQP